MLWLPLVVLLGCGCSWLKKEVMSHVTSCDISVMFKLTCEITCKISARYSCLWADSDCDSEFEYILLISVA